MAGPYLGDFAAGSIVHLYWDSNDSNGASITRATDGTIVVYKGTSTTETTDGITDTEDFDGLTGVHLVAIDTVEAFYTAGANYTVVLQGAVIDGQTVNAVLGFFSIENRFNPVTAAIAEPSSIFSWPASAAAILAWLGATARNEIRQTSSSIAVRDDANAANIASATVDDDGTTLTREEFTSL